MSTWRVRGGCISLERPLVMGIVNTTPDSFSDGGAFLQSPAAVSHGLRLAGEGADIIDVGGESTRPGALPVSADEEIARTVPVVEALAGKGLVVSIDTMKPEVAAAALSAGARIVNDVGGLGSDEMRRVVDSAGAGVVVMHMKGTPQDMQLAPHYDDVIEEIVGFLEQRIEEAVRVGIDRDAIVVDPGIGFGKTLEHNLVILDRLDELERLGRPVMVGTSRKRFLGTITGHREPRHRDLATAVTVALAVVRGASVVRVHDVAGAVESARVSWAIVREEGAPWAPIGLDEDAPR